MSKNDVDYYQARATTHRRLASEANRIEVAAIHEELVAQYEAWTDVSKWRDRENVVRRPLVWAVPA